MGERVSLVTGGAGFIGQHLARRLAAAGDRVRVLDVRPFRDPAGNIEVIHGSVLEEATLRDALAGVDRLFHLAANPNLWTRDKREFMTINLEGTRAVLRAARRCDLERIVYTSTESILIGMRRRRAVTDETVRLTVDDMPGTYCRSKFLAEEAAMAAAEEGLPVVVVNPTLPVGPGDTRPTPPTRMLLGFLNGAHPAYLDAMLNWVDVRDVAEGHVLAAERGRIGERYILGDVNMRVGELLALLGEITGLPMPRLRIPYWVALATAHVSELVSALITGKPPMAPLSGVRLAGNAPEFDTSKARRELGFSTRPFRRTLVDAIAWLDSEGLLRRPLRRPLPAAEAAE